MFSVSSRSILRACRSSRTAFVSGRTGVANQSRFFASVDGKKGDSDPWSGEVIDSDWTPDNSFPEPQFDLKDNFAGVDVAAQSAVPSQEMADSAVNVATTVVGPLLESGTAAGLTDGAYHNIAIKTVMSAIDLMHTAVGVPYWEAIALTTIAARCVVLPFAVQGVRYGNRMIIAQPLIQKIQKDFQENPNQQSPESFFFALKEMGNSYPGLATGGYDWFLDLSVADPTYILPVVNAALLFAVTELSMRNAPDSKQRETMKYVLRGVALISLPITLTFPSGLLCYWVTNNLWTMGQVSVLSNPNVKKMLK